MTAIQTGAVIFDARDEPGLGWACRAGGEAFRIQGVEALKSDTVWWLNANFNAMRNAGIAGNVFFRPANFMRLDMSALLIEWGCLDTEGWPTDPAGGSRTAADIFERSVTLQCAHFGIARARWRPPAMAFRSAMREMLIKPDEIVDQRLTDACAEAYQNYTKCQLTFQSGCRAVSLVCPRLTHARELLKTPIPADTQYVDLAPPDESQSVIDWLDAHPGPMLCRVALSDTEPGIRALINFGANANQRNVSGDHGRQYEGSAMRQWVTGDEARMYANFGQLEVFEAIHWPEWVRPIEALGALRDLEALIDDYDHLSYSLGLYAEQLWTGLATAQAAKGLDYRSTTNVVAPFIRAADRMRCLDAANRVSEQGFGVIGYGAGRVLVNLDIDRIAEQATSIGAIAGLIPPMAREVAVTPPETLEGGEIHKARIGVIAAGLVDEYDQVDAEVITAVAEALDESREPLIQNG